MIKTFDELLALGKPPVGYEDAVWFTMVIYQQDGRTAWGTCDGLVDHPTSTIKIGGLNPSDAHMKVWFSDRSKFGNPPEEWMATLTRPSVGNMAVSFTNMTWGASANYSLNTALQANSASTGKIYEGRGRTIASGTGLATHLLSFTGYERRILIG